MGEDLSLPERLSIRTPMQWSGAANADFSTAPTEKLIRPVISEGEFAYDRVNVECQQRDADSLLTITERMIRVRKTCPEFGWGECDILPADDEAVLALRATWKGKRVLAVHNLAGEPRRTSSASLSQDGGPLDELVSDRKYERLNDADQAIELSPYGFRWFREKTFANGSWQQAATRS